MDLPDLRNSKTVVYREHVQFDGTAEQQPGTWTVFRLALFILVIQSRTRICLGKTPLLFCMFCTGVFLFRKAKVPRGDSSPSGERILSRWPAEVVVVVRRVTGNEAQPGR